MLRNALMTLLADHDNRRVVVLIDGQAFDIAAVTSGEHGIALVPDPEFDSASADE